MEPKIEGSEFTDSIMGKCKIEAFYITPAVAGGGYNYHCEKGFGSVTYMTPEEVIDMARDAKMQVSLAGWDWELVGKKGLGEKVQPDEAKTLLMEAREAVTRKYSSPYKR